MIDRDIVFVGRIARTHGVRGELKVLEAPGSSGAWRGSAEVLVGPKPDAVESYRVRGIRGSGKFVILALDGIVDAEEASELTGMGLFVSRDRLPPPGDDTFYASDLLGSKVEDSAGITLGVLEEIFDNGAHEIYVVKGQSGEMLLPVVEGVVLSVDTEAARIVISVPQGLPGSAKT